MEDKSIEKLRHYIYINPNNLYSREDSILDKIKIKHYFNYTNNEIIKYHFYSDILELLQLYDIELAQLFYQINHNYPALISDIGRFIILYNYGGVYHDLKCLSNSNLNLYINNLKNKGVIFVGETHPIETFRVRSGNIICLETKSDFIKKVLTEIKKELFKAFNNKGFGSKLMFNIGSQVYIDLFKQNESTLITKEKLDPIYLYMDFDIKNLNYKKWQETEELIFNYNL